MKLNINPFDVSSIDSAIAELESYKNNLNTLGGQIVERLANLGYEVAFQIMAGNVYSGETISSLQVYEETTTKFILQAGSVALLFFEFGAGIQGYGHPQANEHGMGPGTYPGQTHALDPGGWWFPTDDPNLAIRTDKNGQGWGHSKGNPPHMPMYRAETKMREDLERVAREVFK